MNHDYKRNGTTTLFAALEVATGKVIGQCLPKHRNTEFLTFLKTIRTLTNAQPSTDTYDTSTPSTGKSR